MAGLRADGAVVASAVLLPAVQEGAATVIEKSFRMVKSDEIQMPDFH